MLSSRFPLKPSSDVSPSAPDAGLPPFPERWPEEYRLLARRSPPLLRAGTALPEERAPDPDARPDPTGERESAPFPFLLRKHRDRVLLLASAECHFHCRFCFRRGAPLSPLTPGKLEAVCGWLAREPEVEEVILSGGDPLTLSNEALSALLTRLGGIEHVKRLRIHTRTPVTAPGRVDARLAETLRNAGKPVRVVIHPVHPDEFRPALFAALRRLRRNGVGLSSQAVLLRGVNDSPETLFRLFAVLADAGVPARYLHHPDRAPGNRSFRLSLREGAALYRELLRLAKTAGRAEAVPPYVLDLPNGAGKAPVTSLVPVGERCEEVLRRVRYRWVRPEGWDGALGAKSFEWWDVAEGTDQGVGSGMLSL